MTLNHRFPDRVQYFWEDFPSCLLCGKNSRDAIHHIISPSCRFYKKGDFNKSLFNSAPLCNFDCHIGNSKLSKEDTIKELLYKTFQIVDLKTPEIKKVDHEFLNQYKYLYEESGECSKPRGKGENT